ncbi:MAG TPA: NAD(P)H-hydrate epimerase [bacterium]|nr:NAD(P)H-hydrate epimerase [bacterium]HPP29506.1 NAD(P)H-hydrate epimerase [bacterium]
MLKKYKILTREEIARIEKETEETYGISRLILMENAGRTLAEVINSRLRRVIDKKICIVAGKGNNGGDGFVATRYLFNMGMDVKVVYTDPPEKFSRLSFTNYQILCKMGIDRFLFKKDRKIFRILKEADVIVDAIFGTGIQGSITGIAAEVVPLINESKRFVVCADIPSGLDADTGIVQGECVKGNITVSFGFAKKGFYINSGPEYCGKIVVIDIGFPRFFYKGEAKNE